MRFANHSSLAAGRSEPTHGRLGAGVPAPRLERWRAEYGLPVAGPRAARR